MQHVSDVKSVMVKAWDIYYSNMTSDGIKPIFGMCLTMAWEHVKNNPTNIISQWVAISDDDKIKFLTANVKKAAKNEIGCSVEDKYNQYNERVLWQLHDISDLVNEACCKLLDRLNVDYLHRLNNRRAEKGLTNISLVGLVYRSAKDAINCVYRDDIKHGIAPVRTVKDKSGNEYSYIDTMASSQKDNTESGACLRIAINDVMNSRDEIDRIIIEGKRDGYTEREIASSVNMSGPAVHKRIDNIRTALAIAIA